MAQGSGFGALFGKGSVFEQILVWQVLGQVLSPLLGPEVQLLANAANSLTQAVPLTPAAVADMVVRGIVTEDQGAEIAKRSGVAPSDFHRLVLDAGEPPAPGQLLEAYRRGIISWDAEGGELPSAVHGLLQGRLRDEWIPLILALAFQPIGVADAVDAVVEGQITHDEGAAIAYQQGIRGDDFQILVNTRGNPPSPSELAELLKRGLIPLEGTGPDATSFQQGIFEGATKDKWWQKFAALADYIPPPRTVTAMVREGSIEDAHALELFRASGLSPDLAAAYLASAHHQKTAAERELAKGDLLQLYQDRVISAADAGKGLGLLGYNAEDQALLLALQDARRSLALVNQAIGRIRTVYVARKLPRADAITALDSLHVPPDQRDLLLGTWDIERGTNLKTLTAAEIAAAFFHEIMGQDQAVAELVAIGYTPYDAWVILSIRKHGALPNPPAPGPAPAGG